MLIMQGIVMSKNNFYEIKPKSWEEAKRIGRRLSHPTLRYTFRGQASDEWGLKTLLERAVEKIQDDFSWMWYFENQIIERFKSRAHQYIQSPPSDQEIIEWLSIIQHYGGPTRLLDFTESFYIAAFFAIDTALENSSVWAINEITLGNTVTFKTNGEVRSGTKKIIKYAEHYVEEPRNDDLVLSLMPSRLNERLAVQKGKFLFPCNTLKGFEANLCATYNFSFDTLESKNATLLDVDELEKIINDINIWPSVIKISFSKRWYREAIRDLYAMNIDAASLFPGLEGFARSLNFIMQENDYADMV